ncbi:MAG: hypothetical protein ACP5H5_06210 [Pyrobaculum sp.]
MILLYSEKFLDVDLPQVVPICDVHDPKLIPLVGEDLHCLHNALKKATRGVVLKTAKRLWIGLARELRPDLTIYVWGAAVRGRNTVPIRGAEEYRGYGVYYIKNREELRLLVGKPVAGLLLDARHFDPHLTELVVKGRVSCGCERCGLVERLLCNPYREVEVL